jgi:hypothetical protein
MPPQRAVTFAGFDHGGVSGDDTGLDHHDASEATLNDQTDLVHPDASEATLNVCLRRKGFEGARQQGSVIGTRSLWLPTHTKAVLLRAPRDLKRNPQLLSLIMSTTFAQRLVVFS